jgi:hypothetical protein
VRALLARELRGATLWAALQCLFGVLANLDHALWRAAHTTTEASLHVFDGDGATALAVIELALGFVMAQRVMLREAEEGTLGALDALPVARWQLYVTKVAVCLAMVLVGVAAALLGNALWTALAGSSLAAGSHLGAHLVYARASLVLGLVGVGLGVATAPARNAAFAAGAAAFAALALLERFAPSMRAYNAAYLHLAWRDAGRWVTSPAALRGQVLASVALLLVGAWHFGRLARRDTGDGVAAPRSARAWWILAAAVMAPTACLFGLAMGLMGATTERVDTARYRFTLGRGDRAQAAALLAEADAVHDRVSARFGARAPARITVELTQQLSHLGRAGQASGLAVAIDRGTLADPRRSVEVLTHETVHAYESLVARWHLAEAHNATKVFNEGLAFALEHDLAPGPRRGDGELVLAALHRRGLLRSEYLVDFEALEAAHDPDLAYPLGECFVRAMMARWGDDAPVRVLRAFGARTSGWNLSGEALWREVMSAAGLSYDVAVAATFARIEEAAARRAPELAALGALRAVVRTAGGGVAVTVAPAVSAVCRFRDPTMRETDRYVTLPAPCELPRGHFAGPVVQVSVGRVISVGEGGGDDAVDVLYEPWLTVRTE